MPPGAAMTHGKVATMAAPDGGAPQWQLVEHQPSDLIVVGMLAAHLEAFAAWLDTRGLTLGRFPDWRDDDEVRAYVVVDKPGMGGAG